MFFSTNVDRGAFGETFWCRWEYGAAARCARCARWAAAGAPAVLQLQLPGQQFLTAAATRPNIMI